MADLLELATQGDPGTVADEDQLAELQLLGPLELYSLWERQQWSAQDLDLEADREQWPALSDHTRAVLLARFSPFFLGEERVATAFAPFVAAAESLEEEAFLATQQVDEVRHTVFFDRFYREVVGLEPEGSMAARVTRSREHITDNFAALFDERLMGISDRLRLEPANQDALVEGIAIYHMVIEGALALTGQHFLTKALEANGWLPGFLEGLQNVSRDEHRHLAFGTWYLQRKSREDTRFGEIVQRTLLEVLPTLQGVLNPVTAKSGKEDREKLGYTQNDISAYAVNSLTRRLKAIGISLSPAAA